MQCNLNHSLRNKGCAKKLRCICHKILARFTEECIYCCIVGLFGLFEKFLIGIRNLICNRKTIIVVSTIAVGVFFLQYKFGVPPGPRIINFLSAQQIAEETQKIDTLDKLFDQRIGYYKEKVSSLHGNILITTVLCILGIFVICYERDIEIPTLSIKLPSRVSYLVIAACLSYYWLHFGFLLHHTIEARMSLMNIIDAEYLLAKQCQKTDQLNIGQLTKECKRINIDLKKPTYQYYYSLTRANDLKDTGLMDAWFLFFLPDYFPTAELTDVGELVPCCAIIAIGCLFGISHALQVALPLNWLSKFGYNYWGLILSYLLIIVNLFFLYTSNYAFYYVCKNKNWLQFCIFISGIVAFTIMTTKSAKKSAIKSSQESFIPKTW